MALTKTTHTFAIHDIALECDVYETPRYPKDSPVFLYFRSGGLVRGSRGSIPPWLVQVCLSRGWPLVSASHRFLPQVDAAGLLADAKAAYEFAQNLGGMLRQVIVGGSSAGCFMATIICQHLEPPPLALLSITGIPTFRHPFFNSSTPQATTDPINDIYIAKWEAEPVAAEGVPPHALFCIDSILSNGEKNPSFVRPKEMEVDRSGASGNRYGFYVSTNAFLPLIGVIDKGFEWAAQADQAERLKRWPFTVLIQGDSDTRVDVAVCNHVATCLGDRARLFLAAGEEHLFEAEHFLEDSDHKMAVVRQAVAELDRAIVA